MIKNGKESLSKIIQEMFNEVLEQEIIPKQWLISSIILLHKKGEKSDINNYRPISLISMIYKIFAKCMLKRISKTLDENQPKEQAGFRKGYSTIDHLQATNQLIEKCQEYQLKLYLAFIDYSKAFDSIEHAYILKALYEHGIESKWVRIIKQIYSNNEAYVMTDKKGEYFPINRGVRQGDPMSPVIFSAVLEQIFRTLNWDNLGMRINGSYLNNLRFADDIVLISDSSESLEQMLVELNRESNRVGLELNKAKTKVMTNSSKNEIRVGNETIEYVTSYTYLGQIVAFENKEQEIDKRIVNGWRQFWSLKDLFESNISNKTRQYLFDSVILPVLTYGAQTWCNTAKSCSKLRVTQRSMERSLLKIRRTDRIRNTTVRSRTGITDVIDRAKELKWNWAGHIVRLNDDRWTKMTTEWIPLDGCRKVGRQTKRWRDDLADISKQWVQHARDRRQWKELGEAYTHS